MQICMWSGELLIVSFWNNGLLEMKRMIYTCGEQTIDFFYVWDWAPLKNGLWAWISNFGQLHIILIYSLPNLLHSKHIQQQIYLKYEYMNIDIYIDVHFIKMFVCQVVLGLLRLTQWLLCQHLDHQWKFKGL